jgi:hypothetical protein
LFVTDSGLLSCQTVLQGKHRCLRKKSALLPVRLASITRRVGEKAGATAGHPTQSCDGAREWWSALVFILLDNHQD